MKYDVIIIGGGPTGINCAIEAQKRGHRSLIVEKGVLVNSIYHFPSNMTFFSTSLKLEIGEIPFISHQEKPTRKEALEYYRRLLESYKLEIEFDYKVTSIEKSKHNFKISSDTASKVFESKSVIIATGFYDTPRLLNISGEQLPKVKHYYDEVHPYIRKKVVVVGGANSACDVALECWNKGAEVTMVIRKDDLYKGVKYWILPNIKNRIKEGSIKAFFNSNVTEIRQDEVDILTPEGKITMDNDFVLAMTGYIPDYSILESIGIQFTDHHRPLHEPESFETNIEGIYVAGVLVGGNLTSEYFIENTRHHPKVIFDDIESKQSN